MMPLTSRPLLRTTKIIAPLLLLLSGCAVGPDFERPPAPDVKTYESTALPEKTVTTATRGGESQRFVSGEDIPSQWWMLFQSEPLNKLIALSLKNNPDLAAADAALREAHEKTEAGAGALFPSIDAGFNATRQKISGSSFGSGSSAIPPFNVFNASVSVSYGPDIFGGVRRNIEALGAAEEYQRFELEAARLTLTTNVVTTAIQEASLRGQVATTQKLIEEEKKQLDVLQNQLQLGAISKQAVLAQAATLAQTRALLPPLEKQLAQTRHQLSALAGQFPSDEPQAIFELSTLKLPEKLPVTLPSNLVEQRPDVRAAEATMHAASAEIGVATANMLPQFILTGDIGSDAARIASLFAAGTGVWSIAAGVTQPLFHGGTLLHQKRASEAVFDETAAMYRKTVIAAFQNVADSLHAIKSDAEALKAQADAERAAAESLKLSQQQFKDGAISYLALLQAEQAEQQAKIALVQAQALRYADTAALFAALGGGWWNRIETPAENAAPDNQNPTPLTPVNFNHDKDGAPTPAGNGDAR